MTSLDLLNFFDFWSYQFLYFILQVQTIGDGYMALSGAPIETVHHAEYMTDFGFSAIEATSKINDPSTNKPLQIRVGG